MISWKFSPCSYGKVCNTNTTQTFLKTLRKLYVRNFVNFLREKFTRENEKFNETRKIKPYRRRVPHHHRRSCCCARCCVGCDLRRCVDAFHLLLPLLSLRLSGANHHRRCCRCCYYYYCCCCCGERNNDVGRRRCCDDAAFRCSPPRDDVVSCCCRLREERRVSCWLLCRWRTVWTRWSSSCLVSPLV
jgi:hypothetical protein